MENINDLGTIDPAWTGWTLANGKLWPPDLNEGFEPNDCALIWLYRAGVEWYDKLKDTPVQFLLPY